MQAYTVDYLNDLKVVIDKNLRRHLPSEKKYPATIHKAMRYSVLSGGKRIRPILAIESSRISGGKVKEVLPAACAIELIHTYSLIHDDLPAMDNDDYRRGKPTSHKVFGEANAILAGDALLTLAFNIIAKNNNPKTGSEIIKELSDAIGTKGMVGGQAADLESKNKKINGHTLDKINRLKTARLFEASAKIGGIASHAGKEELKALAKFGLYFGMAFQIVDDIIDKGESVKTLGAEESRHYAVGLIDKAKKTLKIFKKGSKILEEIADYILKRTR